MAVMDLSPLFSTTCVTEARCKICNEVKAADQFHRVNGKIRKYTCWPCRSKRETARRKLDLLEAFGGKCECCGESHPAFLSLDHVKNDGNIERSKLACHQIYGVAKREGWPKEKYQVLCMNCNFAKGHFGECPHKTGVTTEQAVNTLHKRAKTVMRSRHDYQAAYRGNQHHQVETP